MNILQNKWLAKKIVGLNVIINHDQIQEVDIRWIKNSEFPQTFNKEYQLCYGKQFTLRQLNDQYDDFWSEFQINDQLELDDSFIFCGEGEMGNEGFIVKTDKNNTLQWMLFSTSSNPFLSIHIDQTEKDLIVVKSSHNFYILFNVLNHETHIVHHD